MHSMTSGNVKHLLVHIMLHYRTSVYTYTSCYLRCSLDSKKKNAIRGVLQHSRIHVLGINWYSQRHREGYKKEQTFCGLNGFVLEDIPVRRGSCWAFCRQNCCRSAAA